MILSTLGLVIWLLYSATRRFREDDASNGKPLVLTLVILVWLFGCIYVLQWTADLVSGDLAALPKILTTLVVLFPWFTIRRVLMPLGMVRTAYYLAPLCLLRFQEDLRGGALLMAAWTLLQRPAGAPGELSAQKFLDQRLARVKPLRGASVVAIALLAARRGELESTRALLHGIGSLDAEICPALASRLAKQWLCVDAVARGDWRQVRLLTQRRQPYLPLTRFLGDCAARFFPHPEDPAQAKNPAPESFWRRPPPGPIALWWHWLRAPHHGLTWPLLQRALLTRPAAPPETAVKALPPVHHEPPDLRAALAELVTVLKTPTAALNETLLVQVCRSWETALTSPQTHLQLAKRTLSLGQGDPDAALRDLRAQVASAIGARLRESGLPIAKFLDPDAPPLAATAAQAVRTQLIEEVEQSCGALHDRTIDKRALPVPDEWREWAALLARYQRVCDLGGLPVRRLAWGPFYHEACNWAVWLWNERKEKVLADAVFRFLLNEAEELEDEGRLPLARKNAASGI